MSGDKVGETSTFLHCQKMKSGRKISLKRENTKYPGLGVWTHKILYILGKTGAKIE